MSNHAALLALAACAALGGCASPQLAKEDVDGRIVCDVDRMDEVERNARRSFTDLRWVRCPTARLRVVNADDAKATAK